MFEDLDLHAIQDDNARELIRRLLNLVEQLSADLRDAQAETQRLRDENNRLKGEQGKPAISPTRFHPEGPRPFVGGTPPRKHHSSKRAHQIDRERSWKGLPHLPGCEFNIYGRRSGTAHANVFPQAEVLRPLDGHPAPLPRGQHGKFARSRRGVGAGAVLWDEHQRAEAGSS
jgi:hypothetical protein